MLLGLIEPTSGEAEVLGHSIADPSGYLHRVGALSEAPAFYPGLTGVENLRVFATLGGTDRHRLPGVLCLFRRCRWPVVVISHFVVRAHQMHPLRLEHVTKSYGHDVVVNDLSFTVEPGRVTGFLGPNGAGKSTTMKILLDLASADRGTATIGGTRYRELRDPARTVGVILEHAYHPARSGRNHLRILADSTGIPPARIDDMLELVGLTDAADKHAGAYSLGMQQRLGLAAALLGDPPVLVLDEPGNGLDPQGIRDLRDLLRSRAANGNTVFVSSHLLAEVEHLADEVIVLDRGKLVTTGALSDLQKAGTSVRTPSPEPLTQILEAAGGTVQIREQGALLVRGLSITEIGDRACGAGIALHELSPQSGSLEDLFLGWTGDHEPRDVPTEPGRTETEARLT